MMARLLVVTVLLLVSASVAVAQTGRSYALVIGVETYDPKFLNRLSFSEDDAVEMAKVLGDLGFQVTLMTRDEDLPSRRPSTSAKILDQLQRRLNGLQKEDTLLVSFSGHGVQYKQPKRLSDGTTETHFFCPEEADLTKPDSLVPISKVYELIKACAAERKVLIVDACRNEPISKLGKSGAEIELEPAGVTPRSVPTGMLALYSCSPGEKSYEHPTLKHGVFCHSILKYLKGEAASQFYFRDRITIRGLSSFASIETRDYVFDSLNADQLPELVGRTSDWNLGILAKPVELVITNSIGMKLRLIKAGEFQMGATKSTAQLASLFETKAEYFDRELPRHRVRISQDFRLGVTEVTQGQFRAVMGTTPWSGNKYVKEGTDYPASYVSWDDAVEFCRKLSVKEAVEYRLPTEAEWEYACRAGSTSMYDFGDSLGSLKDHAWFDGNAWDVGEKYAHQVGQKRPNDFGLFDMHGNVYEWCSDWYDEDYYRTSPLADPRGPSTGSYRVFRGGSWDDSPRYVRSANRGRISPGLRGYDLGFRVLRSSVLK